MIRCLARASTSGVTRISVRLSTKMQTSTNRYDRRVAIKWVDFCLGVRGKEEPVSAGTGCEGWVWEREDGGYLNVKNWEYLRELPVVPLVR